MTAVLEARNLYRFFHAGDDEALALQGVSLAVERGEVVAVTGPSGSGKSTLLACLAGLDEPDGGTVTIDGERLSRRPEEERAAVRARSIGMLFQSGNLVGHLTVAGNLALAQGLGGGSAGAGDPLERCGIAGRASARPAQLSGGELARAGLAVALANDPAILLADEPTGELDEATAARRRRRRGARRRHARPVRRRAPRRARRDAQREAHMVALIWLRGLLAHRRARLASTALGVAVGVALLASIGSFLSSTTSQMTHRATQQVAVDWQVEAQPGASAGAVLRGVKRYPAVKTALPVGFAATGGLEATSGGTTQRTGPGRVIGLPDGYARAFPGELRTLSGSGTGVLLAQQTAANLHAQPGDTVAIARPGLAAAKVRVDGVVDLPQADSLFQNVGAPVGAQAQAPPDNVILLPQRTFAQFERSGVRTQIHTRLSHALPGTGRLRRTATSSCWRPRGSRRSRSTGKRCSPPCSAGSAPGCSPTGSPTSPCGADGRP